MKKPILGISMGDPCGIGPEIVVKALDNCEVYRICRPIVIGDAKIINQALEVTKLKQQINIISDACQAVFKHGIIDLIDLKNVDIHEFEYGKVSVYGGNAAFEYVKKVIDLAMEKSIDGTVTGPINKEALNLAGHHFSGHTEIFAHFTKTSNYAMLLVYQNLRVIHVSTHVSLRRACDLVKKARVLSVIQLASDTCAKLGIKRPRIAVAGLNPHAGENGLFGDEEIKEILPAINDAKALDIDVDGPLPPDTIFSKALGGMYDMVVAMYHDQGHIPLKTAGFKWNNDLCKWDNIDGINITVGLPIIRTSVDHGTAFEEAGKGTASAISLLRAIEHGATLAANRRKEKSSEL